VRFQSLPQGAPPPEEDLLADFGCKLMALKFRFRGYYKSEFLPEDYGTRDSAVRPGSLGGKS